VLSDLIFQECLALLCVFRKLLAGPARLEDRWNLRFYSVFASGCCRRRNRDRPAPGKRQSSRTGSRFFLHANTILLVSGDFSFNSEIVADAFSAVASHRLWYAYTKAAAVFG
jgi:hypothetical protein